MRAQVSAIDVLTTVQGAAPKNAPGITPDTPLHRVFRARREQAAFRLIMGAVLTVAFGPIIGWQVTLPVLAGYAVLQGVEWLCTGASWGRLTGHETCSPQIGLALLALSGITFGLPSVALVMHFHSWGVACGAYLLTGAILNAVQLTLGCRPAFWACTAPFFVYAALIPLEVRWAYPAANPAILAALTIGAVMLIVAVNRHWLHWDAARNKEAAAINARQAERDANERRLLTLAQRDALTGLGNRDKLHAALGAALADQRPGALFMVDLDGFKDINDMLGHGTGDEVLCDIAARLSGGCRAADTVTRLGGDEFALVLPGLAADSVEAAASVLLERIARPLKRRDQMLTIGASIGVALFPEHGQDAGQLLANADLALYQAKADGRHCHRVYGPAMRAQAQEKIQLDQQLRQAAVRGEFELFYQPQIRLSDGALMGAEALLRWRHPERGLLSPDAFIGALETSMLAPSLGQWILETACAQAARWRANGQPAFRIAVNLFGVQVRSVAFLSLLRTACAKSGLPPTALEIEITENVFLRQEDEIIAPLHALRALGVGLAFDDYGTGYASLSLLKRYPVSKLKIDRHFIAEICESEEDAVIVLALINLGRALGMGVIAEGVETPEQADWLARNGCGEAQGYAFGPAMQAAEFERTWLTTQEPAQAL
jgi:diguanylate cyclase (GGDEF)-like protein